MVKKRSKLVASFAATMIFLGVVMLAGSAMAATPAELEARVQALEQSLRMLKGELAQAKAQQQAQAVQISKAAKTSSLPSWVDRIVPFGDIRLRYEGTTYDDFKGSSKDSRNRFRVRLRFGVKSQIHPDLKLGFRVVSGADDDPTSTNQTFESFFQEHANFGFDRAYVTWTPGFIPERMLFVTVGKVKNPFVTSKVIWDGDVNPEGAFAGLAFNKKGAFSPFIMGGVMFLNEHSSSLSDVYAYGGQIGVNGKMGPFKFTVAAGYIDWGATGEAGNVPANVHGNTVYEIPSADPEGDPTEWLSSFKVWDVLAKASYSLNKKTTLSLWGHYVTNADATGIYDDKNNAYGFGAGIKYDRIGLKAWYKYVEANATPGFIADSDSGFVNRKGFVVQASYQFTKRAKLALSYFNTQPEDEGLPGAKNASQTIFADFIFKF